MIHKSRPVITSENGVELGTHGTSFLPVGAYDNDYTDREAIWHWHREFEVIQMIEGCLCVSLPNEQIFLKEGELIFINSGVMHAASKAEEGKCILHSTVFLPEFLCNGVEGVFWQKYVCPLIEDSRLHAIKFLKEEENTAEVCGCMNELWKACERETTGYEFTIREQLSRILHNIILQEKPENMSVSSGNQRADERVKTMLKYIHENYMSEISTADLAFCASVSESECLRCFRNVLGITPIQYVKKYRLQLAADMMMTTDYTITEIAGRCGFGHMSYFARAFHDLFGLTPREYRSRNKFDKQLS